MFVGIAMRLACGDNGAWTELREDGMKQLQEEYSHV